ncbi:MAG TPA: YceI family protein [Casimicrobiaceae bacterium]|nr:YceI family protein [Casimicrobiaceae bacterium]
MSRSLSAPAMALLLATASGVAAAAEETYVTDPAHSEPSYEIRHTLFSTQRGEFTKSTASIVLDREAKTGSIDVTIDTTSIRSHDPRLDNILKGEDYFNVAKYPTMTFKSSSLHFDGDRLVAADGELTMIGVSRPVSLKVANFVCGDNPFNKKPMCGAEVTATIKRSEWGMKTGVGRSSGDEVRILIPVEAYRQ